MFISIGETLGYEIMDNTVKKHTKCLKCNHTSHCNKECMECVNDICTGCKCENCSPIESFEE